MDANHITGIGIAFVKLFESTLHSPLDSLEVSYLDKFTILIHVRCIQHVDINGRDLETRAR